ncbi:RNA polymerase sigma factor [Streptomyces sp. NPDC090108]|uniref:RNA polymerase sigma factor n=1 Tax=Streptomyces sp. NPDC090108 TaxID=3365947 RepID=UPI00382E23EA
MTGHEDRSQTADSFTRFNDEWFSRGAGLAMRLYGLSLEDAKEVSADAMTAVYAAWGDMVSPQAYFQHVVNLRAIDRLRANQRRVQETPLPHASDGDDAVIPEQVRKALVVNTTPEDAWTDSEDVTAIRRVLASLPEHYRLSLILMAEGYSASERAAVKKVPESTERTHTSRARTKFSHLLAALRTEKKPEVLKAPKKPENELATKEGEEK